MTPAISTTQPVQSIQPTRPVAPIMTISEFDVWKPILWLVAMLLGGFLGGYLAFLILLLATIWTYYDAKSKGFKKNGGGICATVLLIAIIGLPRYAYKLHKLRQTQQQRG